MRSCAWCLFAILCAVPAAPALAQATGQAWGNATIDWLTTNRLQYEMDIEPKAQFLVHDGQPTWASVDVTPQVAYAVAPWIDVIGELDAAYQAQSDDINSVSLTPRIGAELHVLDRILQRERGRGRDNEKLPRRRLVVSSLVRVEHADTVYTANHPAKSTWRARDRVGFTYPLNRSRVSDDGALYAVSDGELFMPVHDHAANGFVNQLRLRAGVGYRRTFGWRYEALYIWNGERAAHTGAMAVTSHALDLRIRREF